MIAVLGMHRSGTSAVTGMLADQGIDLGPAAEEGLTNPRGTRELREINRLHERILRGAGCRWWRPPPEGVELEVSANDRATRDRILAELREPFAIKDPRMLLVPALWRELEPARIGIVRNPDSVARSLRGRRRRRGGEFPRQRAIALWEAYNRRLLAELEAEPFPVIDFDRRETLPEQVAAALAVHGLDASEPFSFFDPGLSSQQRPGRGEADPDAEALLAQLRRHVVPPGR